MRSRLALYWVPVLALGCAHTSMVPEPSTAAPIDGEPIAESPVRSTAPAKWWPTAVPALVGETDAPAEVPSESSPPTEPPSIASPPPACPAAKSAPSAEPRISADEIPSGPECRAELDRLGVRYGTFNEHSSLVVLRGDSVGNVRYRGLDHAPLVADCRLILAFYRVAPALERAGVSEVRYSGAYSYRMSRTGRLSLHAYGLAIDVHALIVDGKVFEVERDFRRGLAACPCGAEPPLNRVACQLRSVHLFRELLTPDYDADHRNHFHLGLAPSKADKPVAMGTGAKPAPSTRALPSHTESRAQPVASSDDGGWFDDPPSTHTPPKTPANARPGHRDFAGKAGTKHGPERESRGTARTKPRRVKEAAPGPTPGDGDRRSPAG
jgi:hypothetical protein